MTIIEINSIIDKCKRLGFTGLSIEELIDSFIIYLRKSRKDDEIEKYIKADNPNISKEELDKEILRRHEVEIQAYAKQILGFKIPDKNIYREIKSGGDLEDRPVMNEVMSIIEEPEILGVFVYDIERIGRPDALDTGLLIQAFELTDTKILVACPQKIWDLTDEFDRDYFEDSLRQARKFLNYTKTKMSNGRKASVKEGKFVGRNAPYGYNKVKLKHEKGYTLEPNEDADTVRQIFKMASEGMGSMKIARYLNSKGVKPPEKDTWQYAMITGILKRKTYAGFVTYGEHTTIKQKKNGVVKKIRIKNENAIVKKGLHEPLVDEETFNYIQKKRMKNAVKNVPNNEILQNPLAGLVKCKCGSTMQRRKQKITNKHERRENVDKTSFVEYVTKLKDDKGLLIKDVVELTGISRNAVSHYFNLKDANLPKKAYYQKLKDALGIDDRFDELLGREPEKRIVHSLFCNNMGCEMVGSYIPEIEQEVLRQLKNKLNEYNIFIDNYYQDEVKVTKDFHKDIAKLERDIAGLQKQISNACDFLEKKLYTDELFLSRVNELNSQISHKQEQIEELKSFDVKTEIVQYEKAVPVLKTALKNYDKFSIEERNEFLHSFIEKIVYSKTIKRSKWSDDGGDMKLDITFKEL